MDEILYFEYTRKSSLLLIFFFNALVFSFLLMKKSLEENRRDSQWLAAFLVLGALYLCPFMLGYAGWYSRQSYKEFLFFMPFQQLFLIGPVFFFYIKTLVNKEFQFSKQDYWHFLPALLYLLYSIVVLVGDKFILDEFYFYADEQDKDLDFWYQMSGLISMLFYLLLSLRFYLRYRRLSLQELSYADDIAYKWVKHFAIAFALILLLRVLFFIINPEWGQFGRKFWYYISFAILLFYIAITGYANTLKSILKLDSTAIKDMNNSGKDQSKDNPKASNAQELGNWKAEILDLFDSREIHKNPTLTLSDLADMLKTNRNIISKVINQEFDMNFNDFVNERRVKSVMHMLEKGEHLNTTLLGIALDSGFNSKTTFNRAFKKYTGETPKQFIDKLN